MNKPHLQPRWPNTKQPCSTSSTSSSTSTTSTTSNTSTIGTTGTTYQYCQYCQYYCAAGIYERLYRCGVDPSRMDTDPMLSEHSPSLSWAFPRMLNNMFNMVIREKGSAPNVNHERLLCTEQRHKDQFCAEPTYCETFFIRRFRVSPQIFNRIVTSLTNQDDFFEQKTDCTKIEGISPRRKCTAAMKMLTYGSDTDAVDE